MTDTASLDLGALTQLAWVVDDLDAAEATIGLAYGATPWTRLPEIVFGPDTCRLRDEPADFVADISLAYRGDLQLELIRPVRGASLYSEFLEGRGPGLHHVCCTVDDVPATVQRARQLGVDVPFEGSMADGGIEFAYLDLAHAGASYLEIASVGPDMQAFFDAMKQDGDA